VPVSPVVEKTAKFGWCLSNQHEACTKKNGDLECHCKCHKKKEGQKKTRVRKK